MLGIGLGWLDPASQSTAGSLGLLTKQDPMLQWHKYKSSSLKLKWELSWTLSVGNKLWRKLFIPSNFDQRVSVAVKIDQL